MQSLVLLIEMPSSLRENLSLHLRQEGYEVHAADKEKDVMALLSSRRARAAILGLEGLKLEGIALLRLVRQRHPAIPVITINSAERFDLSLECMRLGAYDDFLIPFDLDALMASLREALAHTEAEPAGRTGPNKNTIKDS